MIELSTFWIVAGPLSLTAAGWFVGSEIKRLRAQVDQLLENQKEMAIHIAKLEAKFEA